MTAFQGQGKLDPSLNIDPTRDGIQADVAFTGANDSVPWVVWYENSDHGNSNLPTSLLNADMVFAARAVPDTSGDGGFHWQVVGLGTAGRSSSQDILNTSGANGAGDCATGEAIELQCSLDADQTLSDAQALTDGNGAENPQVTAGTLVPGKPTTPWITWDESNAQRGPTLRVRRPTRSRRRPLRPAQQRAADLPFRARLDPAGYRVCR